MKNLLFPYKPSIFSIKILLVIITTTITIFGQNKIDNIRFGSLGTPLSGITISWSSFGKNDSLAYGYTQNLELGNFKGNNKSTILGSQFDYTFPQLNSNSIIYYKIFDSNSQSWTKLYNFNTASGAIDNKFTFSVLGDSRSYPEAWQKISESIIPTDFTLFLGDIVNRGSSSEDWRDWFQYGRNFISQEPIYHCVGNHDRDNSPSRLENFKDLFSLPGNELYYSFNYGNALFICLNSLSPSDTVQFNWLLTCLKENKDKTWKFIFFHKPFYTAPSHSGEMDEYFSTWWKAFDDYGVDMIFNGHTHNYQRTKPINRNISTTAPVASYGSDLDMGRCQIVAGNAGAPLSKAASASHWWLSKSKEGRHFCHFEIDNDKLVMKAMDWNHKVFDSLKIDKNNSDITFRVDLSSVKSFSEENVFLNVKGSAVSYKMAKSNHENIYEYNLSTLPIGTKIAYNFSYESNYKRISESIPSDCSSSVRYRFLSVPKGNSILPAVLFGECGEKPKYVDFSIDMNNIDNLKSSDEVKLVFKNRESVYTMSDTDADGIYELSLKLAPGSDIKYLYSYTNLNDEIIYESVSPKCSEENGNRYLLVQYEDITLPTYMFNSCDEALPPGQDITDLDGTKIIGSNDNESWEDGAGSPPNEKVEMLIDNDMNTKYLVKAAKSWIEINSKQGSLVTGYSIRTANDSPSRDPKSWKLQGWDDESNKWITLHTVESFSMSQERFKRYKWIFNNTKWFSKYRLKINSVQDQSSDLMQMAELRILGELKSSDTSK